MQVWCALHPWAHPSVWGVLLPVVSMLVRLVGVAWRWRRLQLSCIHSLLALVGVACAYGFCARVRGWVLMLVLCKLHCKVPPIQLRGVV
jgi:hypothetical protein